MNLKRYCYASDKELQAAVACFSDTQSLKLYETSIQKLILCYMHKIELDSDHAQINYTKKPYNFHLSLRTKISFVRFPFAKEPPHAGKENIIESETERSSLVKTSTCTCALTQNS